MQIIVEKKLLSKVLGRLNPIVERRNTIPILSNVKIEASDDNQLKISVTDMDLYVTDSCQCEVKIHGAVTVPMHTLFEIIKKLPDEAKISIKSNDHDNNEAVMLTSGTVKCTLPTLPASDFPQFVESEYSSDFSVDAQSLRYLLHSTKYAMSTEETRYYLNGVYFHVAMSANTQKKVLRAVATDSHRLAMTDIEIPIGAETMYGIIIPKKAVNEIIRILDEFDQQVIINVSRNKMMILAGTMRFCSKLIDGKFPDYNKAIPANNDKVLEIGSKELAEGVEIVTIISSDKVKAVKLHIDNNKVLLSSHSNHNGHSKASQELGASYHSAAIDISFNGKYILDLLSSIDTPIITFLLSNESSAVIVKSSANHSFTHIIMPMQL